MPKKEKPLPKPPTTPFGRQKRAESGEDQSLMADRMAMAAAEGKLDEFLSKEMPDNEYARNLASMMMGMTGMMPQGFEPAPLQNTPSTEQAPSAVSEEGPASTAEVPEDVRNAIMGGDVQGLMTMLMREHQKRNPDSPLLAPASEPQETQPTSPETPASQATPAIDKELIDSLIRIAQDNSVTLDWIILRAIKVYVQEYQKTGKL